MLPAELTSAAFRSYPPQARRLAESQLPLLHRLPLVLVPIVLRELIAYDWKFPAERRRLENQFGYLAALSNAEFVERLASFRSLSLNPQLEALDWVNHPGEFMEQLTAWLWSAHQMEFFRATAGAYEQAISAAFPDPTPAMPRLGIVVIGRGIERWGQPLFRKLKPFGVRLTAVRAEGGLEVLLAEAARRAASQAPVHADQISFKHWYIDGGVPLPAPNLHQVSYAQLSESRALLLERTQRAIASGSMGPENLRSLLARLNPSEIGLSDMPADAVLSRFQLSLLTEGSGTQIFATTFVQWAARECLRRAQPETLLVRYAPRQQAQTMNAMLSGAKAELDPVGSLIDADLGAYYTWLNMSRLSGGEHQRFLVWFEGHPDAIAIGPGLPRSTSSDSPMNMQQVLKLLA